MLAVLYVAIVSAHYLLLRDAYAFPHLCTDAVQYATTGENLRSGEGYTIRGVFNSSTPPLYPVFVAIAHEVGSDDRHSVFLLSCIVAALLVFPAFAFARLFALTDTVSVLLGVAAAFLPHSFYVAFYMTETLQFPLFVAACYFACRWLKAPTRTDAVLVGSVLAALLFNKVASWVVFVAFVIGAVNLLMAKARVRDPDIRRILQGACIAAGLPLVTQLLWVLVKLLHAGTALGIYGTVLSDQGLVHLSPALVLNYIADYVLAAGLISVVPAMYWIRMSFRRESSVCLFLVSLVLVQVLWVAIVDGGLTGMVRERLFSFSLPVVTIIGVAGFLILRREPGTRWWRAASFLFPLAAAALLYWNGFTSESAVETPWAHIFGTMTVKGFAPFLGSQFVTVTIITILSLSVLLFAVRTSVAAVIFSSGILMFNVVVFTALAVLLSDGNQRSLEAIAPITDWLQTHGAGRRARIAITAPPAYYELRRPNLTHGRPFADCQTDRGLNPILIWQLETWFLWNVRTVCSEGEVSKLRAQNDFLLTTSELAGLRLISSLRTYRLYDLRAPN